MNYGKRGVRRKQKSLRSLSGKFSRMVGVYLLKGLLICFITAIIMCICVGVGMFKGILASTPNITIDSVIPSGYASVVYDNEGQEMFKLVEEGSNRSPATIDMIPEDLVHAFVAIEDERFYTHNGIDIKGILRAGIGGVTSGFHFSSGASTITQQLLKNNVFDNWVSEKTLIEKIKRKIQEQYLAIQLEKVMSKEEILEAYLNTINLGHSTLGVQAASLRYFDKNVYELNLSESAVIAAITQNPSAFDPIIYPENNAKRREEVLNKMLKQGWITQAQYDEAYADDVYSRIQVINQTIESNSSYTYFEDALVDELYDDLLSIGYNDTQAKNLMYSGGLSIYSTQDTRIQDIVDNVFTNEENYPSNTKYLLTYKLSITKSDGSIVNFSNEQYRSYFRESNKNFKMLYSSEEAAYEGIAQFKEHVMEEGDELAAESITITPQPQASITIIDQHSGYVLAMVGGRGVKEGSRTLNRAYATTRQPGSTYKVLGAYAPALDAGGKTLATVYNDAPFHYDNGIAVTNYDHSYRGLCNLRQAIKSSLNIITVKTVTEITPQLAFDYLLNFGFTTLVEARVTSSGTVMTDISQSLPLGGLTDGVTNMELTAAYASIANGGLYMEPILYTKVVDSNGNVLIDNLARQQSKQVIKETTAWLLTSAMQDVVTAGTGGAAGFAGQAIAGKTGTTSNNKDVWFAGYTPYYSASVWVGYDNNTTLNSDETGLAKRLWRLTMSAIHADLEYRSFTMPSGITTKTICAKSGKLPIAGLCDGHLATEYFELGTEPTETCDVHYTGWVCAVDCLPACDTCPFRVYGVAELVPVEAPALWSGSSVVSPDGTTTVNTTNMCQHNTDFFARPDADILLLEQWSQILEEQRQSILTGTGSDYFRNLFGYGTGTGTTGGEGSEGGTEIVIN